MVANHYEVVIKNNMYVKRYITFTYRVERKEWTPKEVVVNKKLGTLGKLILLENTYTKNLQENLCK